MILSKFEDAISASNESRVDIAENLGFSLATIYRWQRQQRAQEAKNTRINRECMSIEDALAVLAGPDRGDKFIKLEAIFKLIAWLRWPNAPEDHSAAIATCAITYLSRDSTAVTSDELPANGLTLILKHIPVATFRKMCAGDAADLPNFDVWPLFGQNYDEIDYFADIANFILAYEPKSRDRRDAASLAKAYYAHNKGIFKYKWPMTLESFRRKWSAYGPASPFFYVRKNHLAYNFILDPSDFGFNSSVDGLYRDKSILMTYLSGCRTAVDLLRKRLDSRTVGINNFPVFPDSIPSAPLKIRSLPVDVEAMLLQKKS